MVFFLKGIFRKIIDLNEKKKYHFSDWLIPLCCRTATLQNPVRFLFVSRWLPLPLMTYPAIPQVLAARDAYVFVFAVDGLVLSSLSIIFYGKMGFLDFSINFYWYTCISLTPFTSPLPWRRREATGFNHPCEVEGNGFPKMDLGTTCTVRKMALQSPSAGYHGKTVHSEAHRIYRLFQTLQH